jgi:hypothetical protein
MTEQPKEFVFRYFSRHKYQDLVFYVVNEDGQTNTGLFKMPDTPENRALMDALTPHPVSTPPEGAAPETLDEAYKILSKLIPKNQWYHIELMRNKHLSRVSIEDSGFDEEEAKAEHEVKTWPIYFQAARDGKKPFEYRYNDRDYQVGDILVSREYEPTTKSYSGRVDKYRITYMVNGDQFGIPEGYVIMTVEPLKPDFLGFV